MSVTEQFLQFVPKAAATTLIVDVIFVITYFMMFGRFKKEKHFLKLLGSMVSWISGFVSIVLLFAFVFSPVNAVPKTLATDFQTTVKQEIVSTDPTVTLPLDPKERRTDVIESSSSEKKSYMDKLFQDKIYFLNNW